MSAIPSPSHTSSYTPVPDALLGQFLEHPKALWELPCLLRTLYLLHRQAATPKTVAVPNLERDPVLRQLLAQAPPGFSLAEALQRATAARVLLCATPHSGGDIHYLLDTQANRRQLAEKGWLIVPPLEAVTSTEPKPAEEWPTIFNLYEQYIGTLTPLIAEELKDAENNYPGAWLREAFEESARRDKRSWRYIARILERWTKEGRGHGEPGRHPQASGYQAYLASWRSAPGE